jgi:hypothetical protein
MKALLSEIFWNQTFDHLSTLLYWRSRGATTFLRTAYFPRTYFRQEDKLIHNRFTCRYLCVLTDLSNTYIQTLLAQTLMFLSTRILFTHTHAHVQLSPTHSHTFYACTHFSNTKNSHTHTHFHKKCTHTHILIHFSRKIIYLHPFSHTHLQLTYFHRWSGNSSKWQLIETATHRMPFRGGNSSKKFTHKSPTFNELPPLWQLTECPLRWQLTECPLEVPFTESTTNHSFIQYFVHLVNGCFHLSLSSKIEKTSSNQRKRLYWHPILT